MQCLHWMNIYKTHRNLSMGVVYLSTATVNACAEGDVQEGHQDGDGLEQGEVLVNRK